MTGVSDANVALIQQYQWLNGLNQQWQIKPAPTGYMATAQTNIYYDAGYNLVYTDANVDTNYGTQYYYGASLVTSLLDNGNLVDVASGTATGYLALSTSETNPTPGHYYEATSDAYVVTQYQDVVTSCTEYCGPGYYYDPFDFSSVAENPEQVDIPDFTTTVWAPPIVSVIATAVSSIHLGSNGSSLSVPGNRDVFKLAVRQFIPMA